MLKAFFFSLPSSVSDRHGFPWLLQNLFTNMEITSSGDLHAQERRGIWALLFQHPPNTHTRTRTHTLPLGPEVDAALFMGTARPK